MYLLSFKNKGVKYLFQINKTVDHKQTFTEGISIEII